MNSTESHRSRGLVLFFTVTFLTSWAAWFIAIRLGGSSTTSPTVIPYVIGAFGPLFGAAAVRIRRAVRHEPAPVHAVRSRGWRLTWVLPLLILGGGSVLAGALLTSLLHGPALDFAPGLRIVTQAGGPIGFIIMSLIGGPLPEEPGWRGTAYPRMRDRMGRVPACLLLGVVWAIWHLPLFFIAGTVQHGYGLVSWNGLLFLLSVIPMAALTCFAYERAGVVGSTSVHLAVNVMLTLLVVSSPAVLGLVIAVQSVLAIILLSTPQRRPEIVRQYA